MKYSLLLLFLIFYQTNFKKEQLKFKRVKAAYTLKYDGVIANLKKHDIDPNSFELYIRVFKFDDLVELWGKNNSTGQYTLFREYNVCMASGELGPKRQEGDRQVPEGFYHIDRFNPNSNYHLSLGINYPNTSDKILGVKNQLGGDIFIHGACVTIGCIPITDNEIKSLYIYCLEAINSGQKKIPITFFPAKFSSENKAYLKTLNVSNQTRVLWESLELGYTYFNESKTLPKIQFFDNGHYGVKK